MKLFFLILNLIAQVHAFTGGSGTDVGNGGGLAEKNVVFAYTHLNDFIEVCLGTGLCRVDSAEKQLLESIRADLKTEQRTALDFKSEQKEKGFFKIEGLIRVAKTGDHVGDPIYINQDLLYSQLGSRDTVAMDVPLAVSVLIHELGHHHGIKDHNALDRVGSKLQSLLLTHEERSEFWNGNASLVTYQFNSVRTDADKKHIERFDELVLENGEEVYNLTDLIVAKFSCPNGKPPLGLRIYNVAGTRGVHFDEKSQIIVKPFQAWFIETCSSGSEYDHGDLKLNLQFKKIGPEKFQFNREKSEIIVLPCKTHSEACK